MGWFIYHRCHSCHPSPLLLLDRSGLECHRGHFVLVYHQSQVHLEHRLVRPNLAFLDCPFLPVILCDL